MKKINSFLTSLLLTASVCCTQQANAQAPQKMSYQSVLRNSSNALVANTTVGIQLSVLQGSASGTAVYVETQTATTNVNGLLSLQIGNGTATTGTFAGIDWATGPYFIKTETDPTGGSNYSISGTQEILSVPYALNGITKAQADAIIAMQAQITAMQAQVTGLLPPTLPTVVIGTQTWTSTNLNVTTYRDGTPIPEVQDPTVWAALTTGAWCYYNNNSANGDHYGKLYNWYAVAGIYDTESLSNPALRKQLAPTGWHVSTDAEWTVLTNFLGGASLAGGAMKEEGLLHWLNPNTNATNSSLFSARAGGSRVADFSKIAEFGYWWSSTVGDSTNTWAQDWYLGYFFGDIYRTGAYFTNGYSVRCLKD